MRLKRTAISAGVSRSSVFDGTREEVHRQPEVVALLWCAIERTSRSFVLVSWYLKRLDAWHRVADTSAEDEVED